LTNPDAPINLAEVYSERTAISLGLTWEAGALDGGSSVKDYTINYQIGDSGNYLEL